MKRYRTRYLLLMISTLVAAILAVQANAQMLTFEFSGTLTEVVNDPLGYADFWGTVGNSFTGYLSYDPTFWKNNPVGDGYSSSSNAGEASYYVRGDPAYTPEAAITFSIITPSKTAWYPGALPVSTAYVNNYPGNYSFIVGGEWSDTAFVTLNFSDPAGAGLSGTDLPTTLNLANWAGPDYFAVKISDSGPGYVQGNINSLQQVPEPRPEMIIGVG